MPYKDPEVRQMKARERQRRYRERLGKKEINRRAREWRRKNPEKWKKYQEDYCEKNRERIRENMRRYINRNPEKRRETLRKSDMRRKILTKLKLVKMLGGKCQNPECSTLNGYKKSLYALEFHHLNPTEKETESEWRTKAFEKKIKDGKIQLLCANCHRELHWLEIEKKRLKEFTGSEKW